MTASVLLACMPCAPPRPTTSVCRSEIDDLCRAPFSDSCYQYLHRSTRGMPQAPGAGKGRSDREAMAMGSSETRSCQRVLRETHAYGVCSLSGPPSSEERSLQGCARQRTRLPHGRSPVTLLERERSWRARAPNPKYPKSVNSSDVTLWWHRTSSHPSIDPSISASVTAKSPSSHSSPLRSPLYRTLL